MEWWVYAPIILAVIMFLLVGTVFERRIEAVLRRLMELHQQQRVQHEDATVETEASVSDSAKPNPSTNSLHIPKNPPTKSNTSLTVKPTQSYTAPPTHPIIKSSKHSTISASEKTLTYEKEKYVHINDSYKAELQTLSDTDDLDAITRSLKTLKTGYTKSIDRCMPGDKSNKTEALRYFIRWKSYLNQAKA